MANRHNGRKVYCLLQATVNTLLFLCSHTEKRLGTQDWFNLTKHVEKESSLVAPFSLSSNRTWNNVFTTYTNKIYFPAILTRRAGEISWLHNNLWVQIYESQFMRTLFYYNPRASKSGSHFISILDLKWPTLKLSGHGKTMFYQFILGPKSPQNFACPTNQLVVGLLELI